MDRDQLQAEINEIKHRFELLIQRDGVDATIGGDTLDGVLSRALLGVLAIGYAQAARAAENAASGYAEHGPEATALRRLANHLRT